MGKFFPLNAKLKLVPISASSARYFNHHSEHAQAITWELCNSIASQERPAVLRTCPIGFKDTRLCFFSKLVLNLPLPRGEKERTEVHKQVYTWNKHQGEEGGGARDPIPAVLPRTTTQPSLLLLCGRTTTHLLHHIFLGNAKEIYLQWEFPRKFVKIERHLYMSLVIKGLNTILYVDSYMYLAYFLSNTVQEG